MEGGGWGRRRCGERGRGEGQEEGGEVMERKREEKQEKKGSRRRREDDTLVNEHVHNAQN